MVLTRPDRHCSATIHPLDNGRHTYCFLLPKKLNRPFRKCSQLEKSVSWVLLL